MFRGQVDLPPFLEVRYTTNYGRGIFTKKPIERGTKLFSGEIYAIGVGGVTVDDVRAVCHHCLSRVGSTAPVVCKECRIISYCSRDCLDAARPLHTMECKGIQELEKSRGKVEMNILRPSWPYNYMRHWPPVHALLVARVINKGIVTGDNSWINSVCYADTLPPSKSESFPLMEKYVRRLVPTDVSDNEIERAFRIVSVNAGGMSGPPGTSIVAVYNVEYSLLNHMCKPNCESEEEEDRSLPVFAMEDLEAGVQLGVSYLLRDYLFNIREIRRSKLLESFGFNCQCFVCRGEIMVGSRLWLLEKRKYSLIAPWSPAMAQRTMEKAWESLCDGRITPDITPPQIVELLEPSLVMQKSVLDKCNIMLVLTAITLILNYNKLGESQKAVNVFTTLGRIGVASIIEYGTYADIAEITGTMCLCLLDLGRMEEFQVMFSLTQQFHFKKPSTKALCEILGLNTPALTAEELEMEDKRREEDIRATIEEQVMSGFINLMYEAMIAEASLLYEAMIGDD